MDRITMQNNVAAMNVSTGGNQQAIMSKICSYDFIFGLRMID